MSIGRGFVSCSMIIFVLLAYPAAARAQADESAWILEFGIGLDNSVNGNVNSGAIGILQGQATAILPNPYGDVYGTGLHFRFGGAYQANELTEFRGIFTFQSADADLVRLGDIGPSSLYAQYSDYQSLSLDVGYRRYVPLPVEGLRVFGEGTIGIAFIDAIDAQLAAPQANIVVDSEDFYDQTAAFTLGVNAGVVFRASEQIEFTGHVGLRRVTGLSEVDQLIGTGLEEINNDSARLTFPVVVGIRFRF